MNKITTLEKAIAGVTAGSTIMVGGFGGFGIPGNLVLETARQGIGELTIISEDFSDGYRYYERGLTCLLSNHLVKKAIISYAGGQPRITEQKFSGELDLELVPQGTLVERIRAGGSGIGGFYTPVGVGTIVAEGKECREIDGRLYLFEKPLHADYAYIKAYKADPRGNAIFKYNSISFNPIMAMAADTVILETEELVALGEIEPDRVQLPGVFVDQIVVQKEVAL
ncbi:MAG: CoA transferase subunit A [Lachnospiraceae bacterium]|nr:CoA transferase subunit A [Lachnospiraceae bacterium]MBR6451388.1 CoA transferase subunit A [Lachnospiraceae bacterium]